jgi:pimeloyl-ACP methyl ester carboxylesterase
LPSGPPVTSTNPFTWAFHWDAEPKDFVDADMSSVLGGDGPLPPWRSPTTPACGIFMVSQGTALAEESAITVPVLLAWESRDVVPDPWLEPKTFKSAHDITLFVCPRMAHMHNFPSTRE